MLPNCHYLRFTQETPLANLFVSLLGRLKIPAKSFADSNGEMTEVLA